MSRDEFYEFVNHQPGADQLQSRRLNVVLGVPIESLANFLHYALALYPSVEAPLNVSTGVIAG